MTSFNPELIDEELSSYYLKGVCGGRSEKGIPCGSRDNSLTLKETSSGTKKEFKSKI